MNDSREIIMSADGSSTLKLKDFDECFHSVNGALAESIHIFIEAGLKLYISTEELNEISIFEMGLGTGLNALLTALYAFEHPEMKIHYRSVEMFPLTKNEYSRLNHVEAIAQNCQINLVKSYIVAVTSTKLTEILTLLSSSIHESSWGKPHQLLTNFTFTKEKGDLMELTFDKLQGNIVYYDAFSPNTQPELWSEEIFTRLYNWLVPGGILVTYSSKGIVKQALRASGFDVKRVAGPSGKKHILRATRPRQEPIL